MQRILGRGQIESASHAELERVRKPRADHVFARRAERLRTLSANHSIGDYLLLMAALADSQHRALAARIASNVPAPSSSEMPWHEVLREICGDLLSLPNLPSAVRETCKGLSNATPASLSEPVDAASGPFVMAALLVCWTHFATRTDGVADRDSKSLAGCPVCDSAPVASVVHVEGGGHRYLVCPLCASEWHFVRALCTHCGSSKGISEQSIEGGAKAVRAECCESCHTYRKIFYREHDAAVEPVADDLASLALDLLLSDAGYRRSSGHPLLWQT